jgi:PiT family inorganic phosphate transporter
MITTLVLCVAVSLVAFSNGANDNFKGVASLFGSGTCGYKRAIFWGTLTTLCGAIIAIALATTLMKRFSGKGLVPDILVADPTFLLAVALGAGSTVLLATRFGFPISTTHALTGGLVGAGLAAAGPSAVNVSALGANFVMPLLVSPVIAVALGALYYLIMRAGRLKLGIQKEMCICVGDEVTVRAVDPPAGLFAAETLPRITVATGTVSRCRQRYAGRMLGANAGRILDTLHFLSAGAVSLARGWNDTPKIAGLLLVAVGPAYAAWGFVGVALTMAAGGLIAARRVAETMGHKITNMNPGQGFAANLATATLVLGACLFAWPVSTTHVSVGALLGIGISTRQAKWETVIPVLLSWVVTLPCAASIAAVAKFCI